MPTAPERPPPSPFHLASGTVLYGAFRTSIFPLSFWGRVSDSVPGPLSVENRVSSSVTSQFDSLPRLAIMTNTFCQLSYRKGA